MDLLGRRAEREAVERLLAGVRDGHSDALVIAGEAGIGKSALLEHMRRIATDLGFRVEDSVGAQAEAQFAFAGLHQLCTPLLDRVGSLPEPQQAALDVAFGERAGPPPDRFLVGLAVLSLVAEAAEDGPLLCLVDDAQLLDQASAQTLAFVARRLAAEPVALVFAVRESGEGRVLPFTGLPELRLAGLPDEDARRLLAATVPTLLDDEARERILAEARGNPLALMELPRGARPAHLAGAFERPDVLSVPRRVEQSFARRSGDLPAETQLLLLLAAAEQTGSPDLLWRSAERLGISRDAATPARLAGLMEIDHRVRFTHPLARSAVYGAAAPPDRRRAHAALAAATDVRADPDRRAWHRAQAAQGPDEEVAVELERSATRARDRGGPAAAAALLKLATELTPAPERRTERALEAAYAKHEAGDPDDALALLGVAASGPLDALQRARLGLLRAQITFRMTRGTKAPGLLLDAAAELAPLAPALARETYLQALEASFHAGRLAHGGSLHEAAAAAQDAPPPPSPPRPVDLLLDGLATRCTRGYVASAPELQRALEMLVAHEPATDDDERYWLWLACHVAVDLWDDESFYVLASRDVRLARQVGALTTLPPGLSALSSLLVLTGELDRAAALMTEELAITQAAGIPPLPNARLILAAWRGHEAETTELHESLVREATERGEGATIGLAQVALAALHNGLGNYDQALAAASPPVEHDELTFSSVALPELVEAAVRSGRPEQAAGASDLLTERARASGTPWALGLAARSRALTGAGRSAEDDYREAIDHLGASRIVSHLARAHLVFGEWLRREGRRQDARGQLRTAHELLSGMGAEAYAARAARELRATGEHPRRRTARSTDELTAQELHIARLVATGATSREVAAQLFLSPRTIDAHLRNIFPKLDITSRRQLKDLNLS